MGVHRQQYKLTFMRAAFLAALFFFFTHTAWAADLYLSPDSGEYSSGSTFTVKVMVDSKGAGVNAVETKLTFDKSKLSVSSVSKSGSAFSLWTTEPTFSNAGGVIEFGGGSPAPFSGKKTLATITFKPTAEGSADVDFSEGSVLAADGKGTDVLEELLGATYTLVKGTTQPKPTTPKPTTPTTPTLPPPLEPELNSDSHDDPDKWYATTTFSFTWELPYGISGVKTLLDQEPESTPTVLYDNPPITDKTVVLESEGEWFFHVVFRNSGGWGAPVHRPIKVDLTPPTDLELQATGGDLEAELEMDVTDELSGIHHYAISINGGRATDVPAEEVTGGKYTVEFRSPGEYELAIRAVDHAGNFSEASTTVTVTGVVQTATTDEEEVDEEGGIDWGYILSLIFAALATYFYARLKYERKEYMDEKDLIKKEAAEAQEKLELIFNVLRDEVEEQVHALAQQPNLTDHERRILQKLKDAMDISEELLDKEVEDVRKLLK